MFRMEWVSYSLHADLLLKLGLREQQNLNRVCLVCGPERKVDPRHLETKQRVQRHRVQSFTSFFNTLTTMEQDPTNKIFTTSLFESLET